MLYGLKGERWIKDEKGHLFLDELYNEFTEKDTAYKVAQIWHRRGWNPRLIEKHWHSCRMSSLNQHIGQKKAA